MKNRNDKRFLLVMASICAFVMCSFFVNFVLIKFNIKELKTTDNWIYFKYTKTDFLGKIDDRIEGLKTSIQNRVTNYFPFYQELTKGYYNVIYNTNKLFYSDVPLGLNSSKEYVFYNKENNFYYLINNRSHEDLSNRVSKQVQFFNNLKDSNPNVNVNIYIVPRYEQTKFLNDNLANFTDDFKNGLNKNINVAELNISSTDDYIKKFYKTDHHWNMYGAYQGYKDILTMLNKEYVTYDIVKVNKKPYYGSLAKSSLSKLTSDNIYDVNATSNYTVKVNGKEAPDKFKPRSIRYNKNNDFFDYYIHYFDGQYGLVKYTYDNNFDDNLLIFSDSYAWQIDYLIAKEYKNTYVVNLRFDDYKNGTFNYQEFIKKNNIKDVLFLYEGESIIFDQYDYKISKKIVSD